jgi:hypothetical protein
MCNDFASILVHYPLTNDLKAGVDGAKKAMQRFKESFDIYGVYEMFKFTVNLPFTFPRSGLDFIADKVTMIYSNLHASRVRGVWAGKN